MIRTVISDLGRVLLWFDNDIFIRKLATVCGRSMDEIKAAAHWNKNLILAFDKGLFSPEEFHQRVVGAIGAGIGPGEFFEIYNDIFAPIDRPREVLRRVQAAGYRLLLLSNTDVERFGFVRKRFPEVFFSTIISCLSSWGWPSPSRGSIKKPSGAPDAGPRSASLSTTSRRTSRRRRNSESRVSSIGP